MKKRLLNKYFNQLKKQRDNVRLKRKVGHKEAKFFLDLRKKAKRHDPFFMLFSLIMDGFLGIMAKNLKKMQEEKV